MIISPNVLVNTVLARDPRVAALIQAASADEDDRIYSPRLPADWRPEQGAALVTMIRGGDTSIDVPTVSPSVQVTAWAATPALARQLHNAAYNTLQGIADQMVETISGKARLMRAVAETFPQDVVDPETGWFTVVNHFRIGMQL